MVGFALYMNDYEREHVVGMIAMLCICSIFLFYKSEFIGFVGWEYFLINLYNQAIAFLYSLCVISCFHIKQSVIRDVVFVILFLVIQSVIEVEAIFPTTIYMWMLIGLFVLFSICIVITYIVLINNKRPVPYLVLFIASVLALLVVMTLIIIERD